MSELILLKVFLGSIVCENYVCSDSNTAVTKSCLGKNSAHMLLRFLIDSSYIWNTVEPRYLELTYFELLFISK